MIPALLLAAAAAASQPAANPEDEPCLNPSATPQAVTVRRAKTPASPSSSASAPVRKRRLGRIPSEYPCGPVRPIRPATFAELPPAEQSEPEPQWTPVARQSLFDLIPPQTPPTFETLSEPDRWQSGLPLGGGAGSGTFGFSLVPPPPPLVIVPPLAPVPEPSTLALLGAGLAILISRRRK